MKYTRVSTARGAYRSFFFTPFTFSRLHDLTTISITLEKLAEGSTFLLNEPSWKYHRLVRCASNDDFRKYSREKKRMKNFKFRCSRKSTFYGKSMKIYRNVKLIFSIYRDNDNFLTFYTCAYSSKDTIIILNHFYSMSISSYLIFFREHSI